jgi:hypothetical protein
MLDCYLLGDGLARFQSERSDESGVGEVLGGAVKAVVL